MDMTSDGNFTTSAYTEVTDTGLYTNFKSYTPEDYKASLVKLWWPELHDTALLGTPVTSSLIDCVRCLLTMVTLKLL